MYTFTMQIKKKLEVDHPAKIDETKATSPAVIERELTRLSSHKKVSGKRFSETKKDIGNQKKIDKEISV